MRTFLKFLIPALLISVLLILAACTPSGSNPSVSTADPATDTLAPSETTAAAVEERRWCRSGCSGRHLGWQYG